MTEKSVLKIIEGIKFSFVVSRKNAPAIVASAIEHDLEISYKGFGEAGNFIVIKGIGTAENVVLLMEDISSILTDKVERLDFTCSFRHKVVEIAVPNLIPFVEVINPVVSKSKKS